MQKHEKENTGSVNGSTRKSLLQIREHMIELTKPHISKAAEHNFFFFSFLPLLNARKIHLVFRSTTPTCSIQWLTKLELLTRYG